MVVMKWISYKKKKTQEEWKKKIRPSFFKTAFSNTNWDICFSKSENLIGIWLMNFMGQTYAHEAWRQVKITESWLKLPSLKSSQQKVVWFQYRLQYNNHLCVTDDHLAVVGCWQNSYSKISYRDSKSSLIKTKEDTLFYRKVISRMLYMCTASDNVVKSIPVQNRFRPSEFNSLTERVIWH